MDEESDSQDRVGWNFGLDSRLLKSISKLGWGNPSPVQVAGIPSILSGKDVIAKAKTGSGKTGAYLIPVVQKILKETKSSLDSSTSDAQCCTCTVILGPSKELCKQISRNIQELTMYCSKLVRYLDLSSATVEAIRPLIQSKKPNVLVSTPSKLLAHINSKTINLNSLQLLIIDEADLMFSYGYEKDLKGIADILPNVYQAILVSATMTTDVEVLKNLALRDPIVIKLKEGDLPGENRLTQYMVKCETADKLLLTYALIQLKLIRGKSLIFVNSVDKCYQLKLFLEQFAIKSCVLNSELPQNSRIHIVDEFNKGVYDIVIATDEAAAIITDSSEKKGKSTKTKKDQTFGVARGIDFQDVDNVINFDFPTTPDDYLHRVGRTARGYNSGTALSLVTPSDVNVVEEIENKFKASNECETVLKPYNFKIDEIEGFRYRVAGATKAVTKASIKEARLKEIKAEILNSKKLQTYFEDNPKDLQVLRHDKTLQPKRVQPHLKNIPEYLVPSSLKSSFKQGSRKRKRANDVHFHKSTSSRKAFDKRSEDPLKSFKYKGNIKKGKKK